MTRKRRHTKSTDMQLDVLVKTLMAIKDVDVERSVNEDEIFAEDVRTWRDWYLKARSVKSDDRTRAALYYGFQALYDALLEDRVPSAIRTRSELMLDRIVGYARRFLGDLHTTGLEMDIGKNEKATKVRKQIGKIETDAMALDDAGVEFKRKTRFAENPSMNATHIQGFAVNYLKQYALSPNLDAELLAPQAIIGCACGSFEIVQTLASLLDLQSGYIRYSPRRGDTEARMLPNQKGSIIAMIKNRNVLVVEDYVQTGGTLLQVMAEVEKYNPRSVVGASIGCKNPEKLPQELELGTASTTNFKIYTRN